MTPNIKNLLKPFNRITSIGYIMQLLSLLQQTLTRCFLSQKLNLNTILQEYILLYLVFWMTTLLGDVFDAELDREINLNKARPLATGQCSKKDSLLLILILHFITFSFIQYTKVCGITYYVCFQLLGYFYTYSKHIPNTDPQLVISLLRFLYVYYDTKNTFDIFIFSLYMTIPYLLIDIYLVSPSFAKRIALNKSTCFSFYGSYIRIYCLTCVLKKIKKNIIYRK